MVKACSDVGAREGKRRPSRLSSSSSFKTVSSDDSVIEDDRERAGVDVGDLDRPLARASASDKADRYEAAEVIGANDGDDFFLKIEREGEDLKAIGEGSVMAAGDMRTTRNESSGDASREDLLNVLERQQRVVVVVRSTEGQNYKTTM